MRVFVVVVASALALSACADSVPSSFDSAPLNGRQIAPPDGWLEASYDRSLGDITGEPWICPDGRRSRWLNDGWVEPTCAPDRP